MNKQITEDYVSFEVAKLLKEKGFIGECERRYSLIDMMDWQGDDRQERQYMNLRQNGKIHNDK